VPLTSSRSSLWFHCAGRCQSGRSPLIRALKTPVYTGHMQQRKVLGFYRPKLEEVRVKTMSDLEVTAQCYLKLRKGFYL